MIGWTRRSAAHAWLVAALLGCGGSAQNTAPPATRAATEVHPRDAAVAAALDRYFAAQLPADQPGGAVMVVKHGRVVFAHGYGLADLKTGEAVTTRTLFNLGSLSKTFVASAILQLQERGKLSVEDDLARYFPGFKHNELAAQVRIKHLLTHTSGLPDNREVSEHQAFFLTAKDAENWYPITQADALVSPPGERFAYSNPAFNGLALIVEQVSGMKWQAFVRANIFLPAGMTTSTITDGPHPEHGVAHGYNEEAGAWVEADYGEIPTFAAAGNGGVWSSVDELARYEHALQHGVVLKPATVTDARTVKTFANWADPKPPEVGWSWFITQRDQARTIGHTGSQGGFRCSYLTLPEHDVLLIVLSNAPRDVLAFSDEIIRQLAAAAWLD